MDTDNKIIYKDYQLTSKQFHDGDIPDEEFW